MGRNIFKAIVIILILLAFIFIIYQNRLVTCDIKIILWIIKGFSLEILLISSFALGAFVAIIFAIQDNIRVRRKFKEEAKELMEKIAKRDEEILNLKKEIGKK